MSDQRVRGFRPRAEVAEVVKLLRDRTRPLAPEEVETAGAGGRVLAERAISPVDVPAFDRAAMDGYAIRAEDTFGAATYSPAKLKLIGTSLPGRAFAGTVGSGQAVRIMTGAPLPSGADAVLAVEQAGVEGSAVTATASVPPGKNVSRKAEDIHSGDVLLEAGRVLRPQDLGVLASTGLGRIRVISSPRVDILATGDELLPAGARPEGHRIVDSNSPMLAALVARDGGVSQTHPIVKDNFDETRAGIRACTGDVILISGGTSVGPEDHVPRAVRDLGELPVHGIAMRPAGPTAVGFLGARTVFLLPGNPVSCLCAYDFFAGQTIRALGGRPREWPYHAVQMPLAQKIVSEIGRVDYVRVRFVEGKAEPIMAGGASILSSVTRADGFVIVPRDDEGIPEGATVTVYLYG